MADSISHFHNAMTERLAAYGNIAEFCRKTGIARSQVDGWIKEKTGFPGIDKLPIIAKELDCTILELIGTDDEPTRSSLLGDIITVIPDIDKPELRLLLEYAEGFAAVCASRKSQKLPKNNH